MGTESGSLLDLDRVLDGIFTDSQLNQILAVEIPRDTFQSVLQRNKDAQRALRKLEVETVDYRNLADVLDPDNNGTVGVLELVDGLMRLRGDPRRSDIVGVDLMVRSLQERVDD